MPVLLFCILICFCLGIFLVASKKQPLLGKILALISMVFGLGVIYLISVLLIAFSTPHAEVYALILAVFFLLIIAFTVCILWGFIKKKAVFIPLITLSVALAASYAGFVGYNMYTDSIPEISESDNLLMRYSPYGTDSEIALLDEEPTLKLEGELPVMDGATALFPIYSAFQRAVYPEITNRDEKYYYGNDYLKCSTTTGAYENIVTGEADVIFAAAPSEAQFAFARENGVELVFTPIGREAFVFFVNSKNPLNDITLEQIKGVYSGKITKWSELGVEGFGDIRAFQREEGSGSQSTLQRLMAGEELMVPPMEDVVNGMGGIISKAADYKNHKNAIGYSFRFYSTQMVKNDEIRLLSVNGTEPTAENIENGTYPIASEFYAVTRADADENTMALVRWVLEKQGQEIIEKTGYVPVMK